jgi:hypothetical protein
MEIQVKSVTASQGDIDDVARMLLENPASEYALLPTQTTNAGSEWFELHFEGRSGTPSLVCVVQGCEEDRFSVTVRDASLFVQYYGEDITKHLYALLDRVTMAYEDMIDAARDYENTLDSLRHK